MSVEIRIGINEAIRGGVCAVGEFEEGKEFEPIVYSDSLAGDWFALGVARDNFKNQKSTAFVFGTEEEAEAEQEGIGRALGDLTDEP